MFKSIRWRIATPYIVLVLLAMLALAAYVCTLVRGAHLADLQVQLLREATLLEETLDDQLAASPSGQDIDALAKHYAGLLDARVTIIGVEGTVLGESHEDRRQMDNHLLRPEVQQALAEGQGSTVRYSNTLRANLMYVAIPAQLDGQLVGIVRVALPLSQIEANVSRLRLAILGAAAVAVVAAGILAVYIAERTARPVRLLTQVVERVADGDLSARLLPTTQDEVGILTRAFNQMADRLREMVDSLADERSRLAAVLEHMADGVVIADSDGRVRLINPAARRMLETGERDVLGLPFAQVTRHYRLIELWQRCREGEEAPVELVQVGRSGPFVQAIVTSLQNDGSRSCLVILQDLTRIRQLETVRRDFISNISHELRTPLASLKALVDTLRDGGLEDAPAARRFLDRMEIEVDALTQMVQELLELSRIESGQVPFRLTPTRVSDVVLPAVERLRPQAERAGVKISTALPQDMPQVLADCERVQQVVTNLVHNAIKFTPSGGAIELSAESREDEVLLAVRDSGVGIPEEDLPRIFERFYKVDRARSGGGTGLGLSIAKHIVQGHGGHIWAESVEGQGSTFYFTLPVAGQV
jgi:two-component system phosphate regulon sensor histidine kinase PhoR